MLQYAGKNVGIWSAPGSEHDMIDNVGVWLNVYGSSFGTGWKPMGQDMGAFGERIAANTEKANKSAAQKAS
ncbi:hypothetical protein Slin14017_G074320 [Septoria linicola]|nr:hypothetical protein Slin14017_G074320 [Septoria linicola]